MKFILLMFLFISCQAEKPAEHAHGHDHAANGMEESYTYDPFFLDVIRFQFENEIALAKLGLSRSHEPKTLEMSKQILDKANTDLVQIKKWREGQYKVVPVVTPDEFSLKKLEAAKPSDFEKMYLEELKALTLNGQEITRMGAEQNFEPEIKAYAEKLQKVFTLRLTNL
jgi:uncharacterized protein (DUF305 family)